MKGHQVDPYLLPTGLGGKKREKERAFRQRSSTFSLDFPVINLSNPDKIRDKVDPHYKSYALVSVLWSFDKL